MNLVNRPAENHPAVNRPAAFNFLQIVEHGATSDDLYPVPNGRRVGFDLTPDDSHPMTVDIIGLKVIRQSGDGPWAPSLNVLRTNGRLFVSERRIVVDFGKFVPKDKSSFRPVLAVRPDGTTAKRPKEMVVGHVLMTQLRQLGVRGRSIAGKAGRTDDAGAGRLILSMTDGTGSQNSTDCDHVAIEIILAPRVDPVPVGNDVLSRSILAKLSSPTLSIDQPTRDDWAELIDQGFSPAPGELQRHVLGPHDPVVAVRPLQQHPPFSLISDSGVVPTMLPTGGSGVPAVRLSAPLVPTPPPPGSSAQWRPDPYGRFELRYWDGFGWTEHVHANGEQRSDAPR